MLTRITGAASSSPGVSTRPAASPSSAGDSARRAATRRTGRSARRGTSSGGSVASDGACWLYSGRMRDDEAFSGSTPPSISESASRGFRPPPPRGSGNRPSDATESALSGPSVRPLTIFVTSASSPCRAALERVVTGVRSRPPTAAGAIEGVKGSHERAVSPVTVHAIGVGAAASSVPRSFPPGAGGGSETSTAKACRGGALSLLGTSSSATTRTGSPVSSGAQGARSPLGGVAPANVDGASRGGASPSSEGSLHAAPASGAKRGGRSGRTVGGAPSERAASLERKSFIVRSVRGSGACARGRARGRRAPSTRRRAPGRARRP